MRKPKYPIEVWKGKKFNHLTITGYNLHLGMFICKCDCGRETLAKPTFLFNGEKQTCGNEECVYHRYLVYEKPKETAKHNGCGTRLYSIWKGMKYRCYYETSDSYKNYGGRGIKICDEWRTDFSAFRDWAMSHGYTDNLSIDRIDNDGDYEPNNCRWVTMKEQARNKRPYLFSERHKKSLIEIDGVEKSKMEWCKCRGINYESVRRTAKAENLTFKEAMDYVEKRKKPKAPKGYFYMCGKLFKYKNDYE